jgi:DNA-binding response OmpR family regulator
LPGDKTRRAVDVLVVDDDEAVRASLADILRTSGFTVEVAEDGDVALTLLDQLVVKMIVLDLRMPHRDGFSVLDELDDPPPIVLTSAFSVDNEMRKRVGAKVTAYMQKPVSPHRLLPIVAGIVWAS